MNQHVQPASGNASPCRGDGYARTLDGTVFILEGGDNGYRVVRTDRDEECFYHADELAPWSPLPGEPVIEAGNEAGVVGMVVKTNDDGTSLVKWPGFVRPQTWAAADLEPAWTH